MTEKKTTLPSLWNQDWKKVKVETKKMKKLLTNIPVDNITELHKLMVGWLVGWLDLWHINHCRLFNAKSIFI